MFSSAGPTASTGFSITRSRNTPFLEERPCGIAEDNMTTVKVRQAQGLVLNWLVVKSRGLRPVLKGNWIETHHRDGEGVNYVDYHHPITEWDYAGKLIEDKQIGLTYDREEKRWLASDLFDIQLATHDPNPRVAVSQMYVLLTLGNEVEVPDDVLQAAAV